MVTLLQASSKTVAFKAMARSQLGLKTELKLIRV